MKRHILSLLVVSAFSALFGLMSCAGGEGADDSAAKQEEPLISTDVIQNPKTADDTEPANASLPMMSFDRDKHDFGEIIQGEKVEYSFRFTNTGDTPLVISSAKGSCGCTVPSYPEQPIGPGESDYIRVVYDSEGRKSSFNKEVTVMANTLPNQNKLYISGVVIVPESN